MRSLDLSRWAVVGVKDETGAGRLAQDLRRSLSPVRQLVAPSYRHAAKPLEERESPLELDGSDDRLRQQLTGLQGIITCEDSAWTHRLIRLAHEAGLKVVFIVLWEWFSNPPERRLCDLLVCPHRFAAKIVRRFGYRNIAVLTWPLNIAALPRREISGPARHFVHNIGLLEKDDRKGTAVALEAFGRVRRPDIELVVRVQNDFGLPLGDSRVRVESRHFRNHADIYQFGDVAIQPSKAEGIGFMLLEAIASGLPVITTDYPPMNDYVRCGKMLAGTRWGKYPAEQTAYIPQAHFKLPRPAVLARRISWCATHDMGPISRENRSWAEEIFEEVRVRREWLSALESLLNG